MKKIGVVGAGRLGTALVKALQKKGASISGITSSSFEKAHDIAKKLNTKAYKSNNDLALNSDIIFLTVPDNKIYNIAQTLVAGDLPDEICLFHCSGSLSANHLPEDKRVIRGSFHPLQSFSQGETTFQGIYIAMDGDEKALLEARKICELLEGKHLTIPPEDRALYHAAACITSNYTVALLSVAEELFSRWTNTPKDARDAFWPLLKGSLENYQNLGPQKALTGPIMRGDSKTIALHLDVLPDKHQNFYRALALTTLELANQSTNFLPEQINEIKKLID